MEDTPPARRWWRRTPVRLSVRALMVVVLITAVGLGWIVRRARVQRDAIDAITKAGGKVYYDWQLKTITAMGFTDLSINAPGQTRQSRWPKWLIERLGPDYFDTVKLVVIMGPADPAMPHVAQFDRIEEIDFLPSRKDPTLGPTDAGMAYLKGLNQLRHLKLSVNTPTGIISAKFSGVGLSAIAGATKLQILEMNGVNLADADLAFLQGMTDLRILELGSPEITDAGLVHLAGMVEMRRLTLQGTHVTSAGIAQLKGMSQLENLNLSLSRVESLETCRPLAGLKVLSLPKNPINDAGLAPTADPGFASLTSLNLFGTQVTDEGLKHLKDLPKLRQLTVIETAVTDAGAAELKKEKPTINVVRQRQPITRPPTNRPPTPSKK